MAPAWLVFATSESRGCCGQCSGSATTATSQTTMRNTPVRQVPSVVSCPSLVAGPVRVRPTVVSASMKVWCNPLRSIVAPLMLVVGLQHLAEGCALNRFKMVTYSTHFYHNEQRVGWDDLAFHCLVCIVCNYLAGNVGDEHLCGSTASKQRHRQKGEGGGESNVDARHVCIRSNAWLPKCHGPTRGRAVQMMLIYWSKSTATVRMVGRGYECV